MLRFADALRHPDGCDPTLSDSDHDRGSPRRPAWVLPDYDPFQGIGLPTETIDYGSEESTWGPPSP